MKEQEEGGAPHELNPTFAIGGGQTLATTTLFSPFCCQASRRICMGIQLYTQIFWQRVYLVYNMCMYHKIENKSISKRILKS